MIISGAISGAITDPDCPRAIEHAILYYNSIRKRTDDVLKIAANTGFDIVDIDAVKKFIFMEKHNLGKEKPELFTPNFSMAVSWQRLIEGKNIQPHDITKI